VLQQQTLFPLLLKKRDKHTDRDGPLKCSLLTLEREDHKNGEISQRRNTEKEEEERRERKEKKN
jgi:hypothetical protein